MVAGNICLYVSRGTLNSWASLLYTGPKGVDAATVPGLVAAFEVAGIVGSLTAGYVSDRYYHGVRGPVMLMYASGLLIGFLALFMISPGNPWALTLITVWVGFCQFGPQTLFGLWAREVSDPALSSMVSAILGTCSQLGVALAGYPLLRLKQALGWDAVFCGLILAAVILLTTLWPLRSLRPLDYAHKENERKAKTIENKKKKTKMDMLRDTS
eukprot:UC1_evm1s547